MEGQLSPSTQMGQEKIIQALKDCQLFSGLEDIALTDVATKAKVRQFFPQDVIVWQGQPSTTLFLILNGIVAVKSMMGQKEHLLAYLMPGNSFGEMGILENQARSATVSALSEVDVLAIQRDDFLEMLHTYPVVAIELAKTLGRYLVQSNRRLSSEKKDMKLIIIMQPEERNGATSLSALLAQRLAKDTRQATALMEYPNSWRILDGKPLDQNTQVFHHRDGFDILFPQMEQYLPATTRTELLLDRARNQYGNIVIQVNDFVDDSVRLILEHADQVVLLVPPGPQGKRQEETLKKQLKGKIQPDETSVVTIVNRGRKKYADMPEVDWADIELPFLPNFPRVQLPDLLPEDVPEEIQEVMIHLVERLERNNSIGIFIPTTVDVDQQIDTTVHMDQTMSFMAERFGGATCKVANGVWHSEQLGLVGEVVYIIHSYITRADMNRYLDEVVDYIKMMKRELKQEAMALEVNHKLTLI